MTAAPRATTSLPNQAGSFLVGMNDGTIWMTADFGESFKQVATGLPPIYALSVSRN
jgi:predicted solute-binding protein